MATASDQVMLFLCGDVMLGRGIDQVLPHPSPPRLHEAYVHNALDYVALAEHASAGTIARPVGFAYVWGDALRELGQRRPDARIINLETSVTRSDTPWPKGIHYRMHPGNVPCLAAAGIDCCVLANNHVLDWGREGLVETLAALRGAGIDCAGAGEDLAAAQAPAILPLAAGTRVLVFAAATDDSGVPATWAAAAGRSGVQRLPDLSADTLKRVASELQQHRRAGDRVVFSLHWGGNWGYAIPPEHRDFAHGLVDVAGVDVVHGHSSHHAKALEVHRGRLILYGCGDFLNDYEGIRGHADFRGDLGLMYFPAIDAADGHLRTLELVPTRIRQLRVNRAEGDDRRWLLARLRRGYGAFGCDVAEGRDGAFVVGWH